MTFDEIVSDLLQSIPFADQKVLAAMKETELWMLHRSTGMWIRNVYGLWAGNPLTEKWVNDPTSRIIEHDIDVSPHHPDEVSNSIIKAVWQQVQHLAP